MSNRRLHRDKNLRMLAAAASYQKDDIAAEMEAQQEGKSEEYAQFVQQMKLCAYEIDREIIPWYDCEDDIVDEIEHEKDVLCIGEVVALGGMALSATLLRDKPDAALVLCTTFAGGGVFHLVWELAEMGALKKHLRNSDDLLTEWDILKGSPSYIAEFMAINELQLRIDTEGNSLGLNPELLEALRKRGVFMPAWERQCYQKKRIDAEIDEMLAECEDEVEEVNE